MVGGRSLVTPWRSWPRCFEEQQFNKLISVDTAPETFGGFAAFVFRTKPKPAEHIKTLTMDPEAKQEDSRHLSSDKSKEVMFVESKH